MEEILKCIGAVMLMLSAFVMFIFVIFDLIDWYFTWVFSFLPIKTYLIPVILAHSFLLGSLIGLIGKGRLKK